MMRLEILKPENLSSRFARLAVRGAFGFFPEGMALAFDKIAIEPLSLTDRDFAVLHRAGVSEHQIFEIIIAAAMGAGLARLEIAWQALLDAQTPIEVR